MHYVRNRRGFILITILLFFVLLVSLVAVYLFIATIEMRQAGNALDYAKALALAEAGIERGIREIRDDVLAPIQLNDPNSLGYHGRANMDGLRASGNGSRRGRAREYTAAGNRYCTLSPGQYVRINDFYQIVNLLGTRLKNVELGCRYRINRSGRSGVMNLSFTTDNWQTSQIVQGSISVNSTTWRIDYFNFPISLNWNNINTLNFGIEARMISGSGRRPRIFIDYLFIRLTYELDTSTEPWFNGFNNIPLGDGEIESVDIIDESGKVHLNYASVELLGYLMFECGIPGSDAQILAPNVINYRETIKLFDSIEEIKNVSGMTEDYYNLIRDYITVYSFVNDNVFRPQVARAPVNVNTAAQMVLEAIFDPLSLGGGLGPSGDAARLAQDIINQRQNQPFIYFFSSYPIGSNLYGFINSRPYLSGGERRRIWENADASRRDWGSNLPNGECVTTEFSYYTNSFMIDVVGKKSDVRRRVKMVIKDDGSKYLDTFLGDSNLRKYWREAR